jgi:hypothetical protein
MHMLNTRSLYLSPALPANVPAGIAACMCMCACMENLTRRDTF